MFKSVFIVVLLLATSLASVESQSSCANDGELCTYGEYCCSGYCDYYHRASADDLGTCTPPTPNWGNCSFDGDECANNETCCSYYCHHGSSSSYCSPLFYPIAPPPPAPIPILAPSHPCAPTPVS